MKVLLVDDNSDQLEFLANFVSKLGIKCRSVQDGKNILEIIEDDKQFDAIICSCEMEEINGMDLLKLIDFTFHEYPPFIILSENINRVDVDSLSGNLYALLRKQEDLSHLSEYWIGPIKLSLLPAN